MRRQCGGAWSRRAATVLHSRSPSDTVPVVQKAFPAIPRFFRGCFVIWNCVM
jgi:hypothetical protein